MMWYSFQIRQLFSQQRYLLFNLHYGENQAFNVALYNMGLRDLYHDKCFITSHFLKIYEDCGPDSCDGSKSNILMTEKLIFIVFVFFFIHL